jgi:hypothetical protein
MMAGNGLTQADDINAKLSPSIRYQRVLPKPAEARQTRFLVAEKRL